ncbi:uncharacterized [Tachysurus ichikawai]
MCQVGARKAEGARDCTRPGYAGSDPPLSAQTPLLLFSLHPHSLLLLLIPHLPPSLQGLWSSALGSGL